MMITNLYFLLGSITESSDTHTQKGHQIKTNFLYRTGYIMTFTTSRSERMCPSKTTPMKSKNLVSNQFQALSSNRNDFHLVENAWAAFVQNNINTQQVENFHTKICSFLKVSWRSQRKENIWSITQRRKHMFSDQSEKSWKKAELS